MEGMCCHCWHLLRPAASEKKITNTAIYLGRMTLLSIPCCRSTSFQYCLERGRARERSGEEEEEEEEEEEGEGILSWGRWWEEQAGSWTCGVLLLLFCLDAWSLQQPQPLPGPALPPRPQPVRTRRPSASSAASSSSSSSSSSTRAAASAASVASEAAARPGNLSASAESKVERLGLAFKRNLRELREKSARLDAVFLVDESSSVGAGNFRSELRFVRKTLADFPVAPEHTRVAIVTFSSKSHVVTRVDHISAPAPHMHKCSLFNREIPGISYRGGGTYTKGAFQRAAPHTHVHVMARCADQWNDLFAVNRAVSQATNTASGCQRAGCTLAAARDTFLIAEYPNHSFPPSNS
ncbi:unnamed protein product [Arctogadus glacialis]